MTIENAQQLMEIDASYDAIVAAMRDYLQSLPPEGQAKMLNLLEKADPGNFSWWLSILVGEMPDTPPEE